MWDWAVWATFILGTLTGIAAFALLVSRSMKTFRVFKETNRAVAGSLDEFAAKAEAAANRLAVVDDTAELQESVARLRVSLARLAVLRAAIDEVDASVGRAVAVVPHK
jgi:hypothetical protein